MNPPTIRFGHSPDPDDAFMYYPLGEGRVDREGLRFEQVLEDIESLNRRALDGELETTAASVHACAYLSDRYAVLPCGASMGEGYGPIVVAREAVSAADLPGLTLAIPGTLTSAYLALRLAIGRFEHVTVPFDQIPRAVADGKADAGLLIHEGQLTFAREGLRKVLDLGVWWRDRTDGLPLPLGVNLVRKDLGEAMMGRIGRVLRRAIEFSLTNRDEALGYARRFGRGLDTPLTDRFVSMYVNDRTLDCGPDGRRSMHRFLEEGVEASIIEPGRFAGLPVFVELEPSVEPER